MLWQQQEHIPEIMSSGCFLEYKFYRLLNSDEPSHVTYVIQYFALSMDNYNRYINEIAPGLRKKALEKWGNNVVAFRTAMQAVN